MKINSIQNHTNTNKTPYQKTTTSFGMAYDLKQWNKTFDNLTEDKFLNSITQKINTKSLKLTGKDSLSYKFNTPTGKLIYTPETKGLMANFKFIPNNDNEVGFYIIDNGVSPLTSKIEEVTKNLNREIKRQIELFRRSTANHNNKIGHTVVNRQQILRTNSRRNIGTVAYYVA
ncbi:MAG: hypothetical protein MJ229_06665 [bacterium]|nr:hypothetical protein [bacterium]